MITPGIAADTAPALERADTSGPGPASDRRRLLAGIQPFQGGTTARSVWQFLSTCGLFLALNALMYAAAGSGRWWLALLLAVPASGLLVRLFIIQHDCGHGSFFRSRLLNIGVGRFCSLFTVTPFQFWRRQHNNHHGCFNNLDRREPGIDLYSTCTTVAEFEALPRRRQSLFRLMHHPLVAQILVPPLVFIVLYRFTFDAPASWRRERISVRTTNLSLLLLLAVLVALFGIRQVMLVQLPIVALGSIVGAWLFTVQHRFEAAQWHQQACWNPVQAALEGSSYLRLPRLLQWMSGSIGFHHVHHLAPGVPNYRLQECHEAQPGLQTVTTLSLREALGAPAFLLWDQNRSCMTRIPSRRRGRAARSAWIVAPGGDLSTRPG